MAPPVGCAKAWALTITAPPLQSEQKVPDQSLSAEHMPHHRLQTPFPAQAGQLLTAGCANESLYKAVGKTQEQP